MSYADLFLISLSLQLVSAFVNQYYHVLRLNPEAASKFYVDSSIFSRAEAPRVEAEVVVTQNVGIRVSVFETSQLRQF